MIRRFIAAPLVTVSLIGAMPAQAQQTGEPLAPGAEAPDFAITGSTRYGVLQDPIHLSDFRGKTVVLAFFFRARTPG